jgi:hypothetical protein
MPFIEFKSSANIYGLVSYEVVGEHPTSLFKGNGNNIGYALTRTVSCQLPTATAWVRSQVKLCGICGVQSGNGVGFLRVNTQIKLIGLIHHGENLGSM